MHNLKPKRWSFSNKCLLACVEAIKKDAKINREYDIPFLAGYSEDGKTIYVDKDMPEGYAERGGQYVHAINYLLFHEGVEKALLDQWEDVTYDDAHEVAQHVEQSAVDAAGIDDRQYNAFMDKWVKKCEAKKNPKLPPDLDMTPYEESEQ